MFRRPIAAVAAGIVLLAGEAVARADDYEPTFFDIHDAPTFGRFLGGAATAFFGHEAGHVLANLAYGNKPHITPITYAHVIPWFVVDARLVHYPNNIYRKEDGELFPAGKHGYFVINTAGFQVQNVGNEVLLTTTPDLRHEFAPYRKGYLLMNMGLSIVYGSSALLQIEDVHGDLHGASERSPYSHGFLAVTAIAPAVIDFARYLFPDNGWLPWLSRGSKALFLGMDVKW